MEISNKNINKLLIDAIEPEQITNWEELDVRYDSRQSFYKKAFVGEYVFKNNQKVLYLKSYNTIVACIYKNQLRVYGYFSQTTARHIREFAKQNDFWDKITAQQMKNTCVFVK